MMFHAYMVQERKKDGHVVYHSGATENIVRQFVDVKSNGGTKELVYYQSFRTLNDAKERAKEIDPLPDLEKEKLVKNLSINQYRMY